jgi:hypothetical protein
VAPDGRLPVKCQVGERPETTTVGRAEMQQTSDLVDYRWRAQYYQVEEENLGDLAYYTQWLIGAEGPTLVIPAGAGRLLPLAQLRPDMFFCDREPAMVQMARSRLSGLGLSEQLVFQGDIFSLPTNVSYAAIVVPAESTQMFDPELLPQMLAALRAALKHAGSLVLDLATFDPLRCDDPEAPRYFRPDFPEGTSWKQWCRQAQDGSWVTRQVAHRDYGTHIDFTFTYTVESPKTPLALRKSNLRLWRYDQEQLINLAGEAGFECELCETSYATQQKNQGPRLIVTLKKAELR